MYFFWQQYFAIHADYETAAALLNALPADSPPYLELINVAEAVVHYAHEQAFGKVIGKNYDCSVLCQTDQG